MAASPYRQIFFFFQVQTRGAAWQLVPALNGNNGKEKTPVQKPYEEDHQNWKLGIYYPASQPVGCWTRTRQASLCVLLMTLTLLVCLGIQSPGHNGKEPSGMYLEFRRLFHRSLCRNQASFANIERHLHQMWETIHGMQFGDARGARTRDTKVQVDCLGHTNQKQ